MPASAVVRRVHGLIHAHALLAANGDVDGNEARLCRTGGLSQSEVEIRGLVDFLCGHPVTSRDFDNIEPRQIHPRDVAAHSRAELNVGVTPNQIQEVLLQTALYCGLRAAHSAFHLALEVFSETESDVRSGGSPGSGGHGARDVIARYSTMNDAPGSISTGDPLLRRFAGQNPKRRLRCRFVPRLRSTSASRSFTMISDGVCRLSFIRSSHALGRWILISPGTTGRFRSGRL